MKSILSWSLGQNSFGRVGEGNSSIQLLSRAQLFVIPWPAACQASLSITNYWSLLKLMSIQSMMPSTISSSVIPFSFRLQSFPASGSFPLHRFFASGGQSIGASASTSVLPMNSALISFTTGWLDLLAVQRTLKSLLQHHSSRASVLRWSAFFMV